MLLFFSLFMGQAYVANAQNRKSKVKRRVDSLLSARYFRSSYDTNYVVRPEGKLTLKVRLNQTGNTFHAKGTVNGVNVKGDLSAEHKITMSIAASFRGLSAALAINPAKLSGAYNDYEINLNYYSSRFSLDFSYQRSKSLTGDIRRDDRVIPMEKEDLMLKVFNIVGYYTFNHHRFSYPAAFTQSYIQRRSAGSWLAGISYQGGSIKTTEEMKQKNPTAHEVSINVGHIGIGGGYGYNLVLGKRWLLHLSMLPTFVVYNRNKLEISDVKNGAHHMRFNMIFNERAAIVRNFTSRFFGGATLVMTNSLFDDDEVVVNQNKWLARAFFGIRL